MRVYADVCGSVAAELSVVAPPQAPGKDGRPDGPPGVAYSTQPTQPLLFAHIASLTAGHTAEWRALLRSLRAHRRYCGPAYATHGDEARAVAEVVRRAEWCARVLCPHLWGTYADRILGAAASTALVAEVEALERRDPAERRIAAVHNVGEQKLSVAALATMTAPMVATCIDRRDGRVLHSAVVECVIECDQQPSATASRAPVCPCRGDPATLAPPVPAALCPQTRRSSPPGSSTAPSRLG